MNLSHCRIGHLDTFSTILNFKVFGLRSQRSLVRLQSAAPCKPPVEYTRGLFFIGTFGHSQLGFFAP